MQVLASCFFIYSVYGITSVVVVAKYEEDVDQNWTKTSMKEEEVEKKHAWKRNENEKKKKNIQLQSYKRRRK